MSDIQTALFEEDYLLRTNGQLVKSPYIAIAELVANAWDAGAFQVNVDIPLSIPGILSIEDDGTGMTYNEFHNRWMKLGYNRLKHQSERVNFPPGRPGNRLAYGRNGIGRHGLLCFNNKYKVITQSDGKGLCVEIETSSEECPLIIKSEKTFDSKEHGTRLEVEVEKNLPDTPTLITLISNKFLYDPQFEIKINGEKVAFKDHQDIIEQTVIKIQSIELTVLFVDSQTVTKKNLYQGIAFWQSNRLVGEPSWILGKNTILDGRTRYAKRYSVVIQTNDLADYVKGDWSGFIDDELIEEIYEQVGDYIEKIFKKVAQDNIEETKRQIKSELKEQISNLSPRGKYDLDVFIENMAIGSPTTRPENISIAVEAMIKLENSKSGTELLKKISNFTDEDVEGLNKLLEQWTIKDALCILDEIDQRISIVEAIRILSSDTSVDELHILHPLITEARWIFGPEYDSHEYTSNRTLITAAEKIFKVEADTNSFNNPSKRPDLLILPDSTISITGIDEFEPGAMLCSIKKVLIIELKKGGANLSRKERDQASGYVEDFTCSGLIPSNPYFSAFVVGKSFSEKLQPIHKIYNDGKVEVGIVNITTYSQLVDTASKRLFNLRHKLNDRYDDLSGIELVNKINNKKSQTQLTQ